MPAAPRLALPCLGLGFALGLANPTLTLRSSWTLYTNALPSCGADSMERIRVPEPTVEECGGKIMRMDGYVDEVRSWTGLDGRPEL